ncbi:MAG: hypothetical protein DRP09_12135 [Candidatus Thorarchaeota archaeon]|nr:MAG: hypothetical protein DRP09_12135 [Candidatus Thorarchaeota archaeon]
MTDIMTGFTSTLVFDDSTITEARMHSYMSYTGTAYTCEVGDYDNWATDSLYFAGISLTRYPYKSYAELLSSPYTATNISVGYDAQEGAKRITVINNTVTTAVPAEDVVAGQQIMMSDEGNHTTTDTHDGMVGVADGSTAAEIAATIGIAMTNSDVPVTHTGHTYDSMDYDETNHPHIEVMLWR